MVTITSFLIVLMSMSLHAKGIGQKLRGSFCERSPTYQIHRMNKNYNEKNELLVTPNDNLMKIMRISLDGLELFRVATVLFNFMDYDKKKTQLSTELSTF